MQAQAYFDVQEWEKVEASARKLLDYPRLSEEDEYNGTFYWDRHCSDKKSG